MILWTDFETTGLTPAHAHFILEAGFILTDDDLNEIDHQSWILHFQLNLVRYAGRPVIDNFVREMHTKNGLWDLCAIQPEKRNHAWLDEQVLTWLASVGVERGKVPMAGSTISFDREFTAQWLPGLQGFLHYRNIDVSTTRNQVERWAKDLVAGEPKKRDRHRTIDDIEDSLELMRYYKEQLFDPRKGT